MCGQMGETTPLIVTASFRLHFAHASEACQNRGLIQLAYFRVALFKVTFDYVGLSTRISTGLLIVQLLQNALTCLKPA